MKTTPTNVPEKRLNFYEVLNFNNKKKTAAAPIHRADDCNECKNT